MTATAPFYAGTVDACKAAIDRAGTIDVIMAALDQAAQREAEHLDAISHSLSTLELVQQRMAALEELIAGYRRHVGSLVVLVRERQRRDADPMPLWCVTLREAEAQAILLAHRHDAYALRVVTEGEACADAPCPEDLPQLAALAAEMVRGVRHG